jgi:hypothetical protein
MGMGTGMGIDMRIGTVIVTERYKGQLNEGMNDDGMNEKMN